MRLIPALSLTAAVLLAATGCGGSPAAPAPGTAAPGPPATSAPVAGSSATGSAGAGTSDLLRFFGSTVDGRTFSGESLAGKPAVLWFWAPWCTVCRAEAPDIEAAQRRFADRVQFVGVPGLGKLPDMRRFVADTDLGAFPHVIDADGGLWERFGVPAQPAFAFVGRDGKVEVSIGALSAEELAARLDRLTRG